MGEQDTARSPASDAPGGASGTSDLWPRRQARRDEAARAAGDERATDAATRRPHEGTGDLRPRRPVDQGLRQAPRPEGAVALGETGGTGDLRPETTADPAMQRDARDAVPAVSDLRTRVERVQASTGQHVTPQRPPITGIQKAPTIAPPAHEANQGQSSAPAPGARPPTTAYPVPGQNPPPGAPGRPPSGPPPGTPPNPSWQGQPPAPRQPWPGQPPTGQPGPGSRQQPPPQRPPAGAYPPNWQQGPAGQPLAPPPGVPGGSRPGGQMPPAPPWQGGPPAGVPWQAPPPGWQPGPQQPWTGQPWPGQPPAPGQWEQPGPAGQPWPGQHGPAPYAAPWNQPATVPASPGEHRTPWGFIDLVITLVVGFVLFLVFSFIAWTLLDAAGHKPDDVQDPVSLVGLGLGMYLGFGVAVWGVLVKWRRVSFTALGFRRTNVRTLLTMIPLAVLMLIIAVVVGTVQQYVFGIDPPDPSTQPLGASHYSVQDVMLLALLTVVLAPFFEELVFRGVLFQYLRGRYAGVTRGVIEAVLLSALAFAALHVSILVILPLGIVLAIVMHRTNSLWASMTLHGLYNALVLLIVVLGSMG